jgi:predicted DCC family thiol-disulfide oxidoreductase YuxK
MLIDTDMENETYIEDCEVCCRPIEVNFTLRGDQINSFNYTAVQGNE